MKLTKLDSPSHNTVMRVDDLPGGLSGIIAVHSCDRGPAAGGLRMREYVSFEAALTDALRLSRGMTLKNAAADLPLGGGKAVIIGDPRTQKSPELLRAFGEAINALDGQYWTAEDMGMAPADMVEIATSTAFVGGLPQTGTGSGDPSPVTAQGVFNAIRISAEQVYGTADLDGRSVAIQGLGHVGRHLAELLEQAGCVLTVADINQDAVAAAVVELGAASSSVTDIFGVEADIFAPCAIGAILNADTIPQLKCKIVAGAANNQLATDGDADLLHARGILYAPDFVANGGGIINVASEILKIDTPDVWALEKLTALETTMRAILTEAKARNVSPHQIAEAMVTQRLRQVA